LGSLSRFFGPEGTFGIVCLNFHFSFPLTLSLSPQGRGKGGRRGINKLEALADRQVPS
jgi:hypothetical protein